MYGSLDLSLSHSDSLLCRRLCAAGAKLSALHRVLRQQTQRQETDVALPPFQRRAGHQLLQEQVMDSPLGGAVGSLSDWARSSCFISSLTRSDQSDAAAGLSIFLSSNQMKTNCYQYLPIRTQQEASTSCQMSQ